MKKISLLLLTAALTASTFAQKTKDLGPHAQEETQQFNIQCQSTFVSGSGSTYLSFCTSPNGNISGIQTPAGWNQLYNGAEGYGICDVPTGQKYYDWGRYGDSGNWGAAVITQPNGPSTFPLKITRTTSDGLYTLTQAFSRDTKSPAVKVTMTLKNNSGGLGRQAYLARFADIDAETFTYNLFGRTELGAWGTPDGNGGAGLIARASSYKLFSYGAVVKGFQDPCNPTPLNAPYNGDGASYLVWVPQLAANSSETVSMEYRAF